MFPKAKLTIELAVRLVIPNVNRPSNEPATTPPAATATWKTVPRRPTMIANRATIVPIHKTINFIILLAFFSVVFGNLMDKYSQFVHLYYTCLHRILYRLAQLTAVHCSLENRPLADGVLRRVTISCVKNYEYSHKASNNGQSSNESDSIWKKLSEITLVSENLHKLYRTWCLN